MDLKFSHVDVLFNDIEAPAAFHREVLGYKATPLETWQRGSFHVETITLFNGDHRTIFVKPISGVLRTLLDEKGDGFTYRIAYTTRNLRKVYADLVGRGIQPENENAEPLAIEDIQSPVGVDVLWMPRAFGMLSIELIEEDGWEEFVQAQQILAA